MKSTVTIYIALLYRVFCMCFAFSALTLLVVGRKGIRPVKNFEWCSTGMVICLERDADLHMAQLMPLPLTVSCFSKILIGLPFLYRLTRVVPEKGPLNVCVCVCVRACVRACVCFVCVHIKWFTVVHINDTTVSTAAPHVSYVSKQCNNKNIDSVFCAMNAFRCLIPELMILLTMVD